jgi:ribose transport system ATP-binding protein
MIVLRDGQNVGERVATDHSGHRISRAVLEPQLISMMVGREIHDIYLEKNRNFGKTLLEVRDLTLHSPTGKCLVDRLSFDLKEGEVLGLGGLLGAGRSETFEAIFGVLNQAGPRKRGYRASGTVRIKGQQLLSLDSDRPIDAIRARMAYVSEDRKGSGLVLGQSIFNNMILPGLSAGHSQLSGSQSMLSRVRDTESRAEAAHWMKQLRVRAASMDQPVGELSGGNQQKVVLAKWLLTKPEILFLDEPTRGIDVGAKVEIYQWVHALSEQGIGVVLASSEMPELLGLCHRILVLREGRLSAELPGSAHQEEIMRAASL